MDAAALGDVGDLGFDLGFMDDGFECFDFDLDLLDKDLAEFCAGEAEKEGGLFLDLGSRDGDGGEGGRERSPDSVVTDDGAPPSSESLVDRDDAGMSAYVTDLERFLLQDDGEAGGLFAAKDLAPDGHFFDHLPDDGYVEPSIAAEEFAADDHFFGDIDDGYAEPATPGKDLVVDDYFFGGYIEPSAAGEDLVSDHDYFYDLAVADDGCVEPAASAGVDDAASATEEEEEEEEAAREDDDDDDEATSRKRARQRKATAVMRSEAEQRETPVMHHVSSISTGNGCRPLDHHWLHPCISVCLLA